MWGELEGLLETQNEFVEELQCEFRDSTDSRSVYNAMGRRIKVVDESMKKYVQDMVAIGRRGNLTIKSNNMIYSRRYTRQRRDEGHPLQCVEYSRIKEVKMYTCRRQRRKRRFERNI